ncbi:MAG TPA: Lpg1974 family pore-forming outer membrane protein [Chlamydiales bacterium]|nr:Lpg1974 family pore-forming outer membrane protein [Chlamydiales bacterium]
MCKRSFKQRENGQSEKYKEASMKKFELLILLYALTSPLYTFSDCDTIDPSQECEAMIPPRAQIITTPTNPVVNCSQGLFVSAEYLFMKATEGGLTYSRQNFPFGPFSDQKNRECFEVSCDWNSGCRVGLGYNMVHDQWDTQVLWTWVLNVGHDHHTNTENHLFSANAVPGISAENGVMADTFSSHIHIHLNLIDWQLGREFFLSQWLKMRPFIGVRTGFVNQNWMTTATGNIVALNDDLTKYIIELKQDFWGIGPTVGFNSEWGLVCNFSLYANGSVALLSGFFDNYRNDRGYLRSPPAEINNPFSKHPHHAQSITELQLGLRWNQWFRDERYRLSIQAGWNAIFLNDHNHLFAINGQASNGGASYGQTQHLQEITGDLMFQGISLGCRLDY